MLHRARYSYTLVISVFVLALSVGLYFLSVRRLPFREGKGHSSSELQLELVSKLVMPSEMSLNVVNKVRSVLKHFVAIEQSEGAGALVKRSIGTGQMRNFPPFLMLDNFEVTPPAGFPEHPHHGQETITYVLRGMMAHEDFTGSKGVLRPGDLQFMTAGQAIVHSEIPVKMDNGESTQGLQLWVDLPNDMKNVKPRYRDLRREEIPLATPSDSLKVKVISGESYGLKSLAELAYTPVEFYHFIASKKNTEFAQPLQDQFSSFIYVMKGSINISNKEYPEFSTIFFKNDGDGVKGFTTSDDAEFAVISGKYFNQKVVQYGPFVESSRENIIDVIQNYQNGANGFENAKTWSPVIKSGVTESEVQQYLPKSN